MKDMYIILLNLIISVITIILKKRKVEEPEHTEENNTEDIDISRSSRNTLYKLLIVKRKLEQHKAKKLE